MTTAMHQRRCSATCHGVVRVGGCADCAQWNVVQSLYNQCEINSEAAVHVLCGMQMIPAHPFMQLWLWVTACM